MITRSIGTEFLATPEVFTPSHDVHISGVYYPRIEELQGYIQSYNILHHSYYYDPYADDDLIQHDRHLYYPGCPELVPTAMNLSPKYEMQVYY
jgi:hypothetical protein